MADGPSMRWSSDEELIARIHALRGFTMAFVLFWFNDNLFVAIPYTRPPIS